MSLESPRVAIGVATFYTDLAERLETVRGRRARGAGGRRRSSASRCPGAFELPVIAKYAAEAGFDAVILLGAVIRGQTSHYDHVCEEVARGIMEVQLSTGVPCGFGVLTVENHGAGDRAVRRRQARQRASTPFRPCWRSSARKSGSPRARLDAVVTAAIIFTIVIHTLGVPVMIWAVRGEQGLQGLLELAPGRRRGRRRRLQGCPTSPSPVAPAGGGAPLPDVRAGPQAPARARRPRRQPVSRRTAAAPPAARASVPRRPHGHAADAANRARPRRRRPDRACYRAVRVPRSATSGPPP